LQSATPGISMALQSLQLARWRAEQAVQPRRVLQPMQPARSVIQVSAAKNEPSFREKATSKVAAIVTAVAMTLGAFNGPAQAIYNKGDPITDPAEALAVVLATKVTLQDVVNNVNEFADTCPAPTYPCDLSVLLKKSISRVSGPLGRSIPTLTKEYGADPYTADDTLRAVTQVEAIFKDNNARVKVDLKSPIVNIEVIKSSLAQFLGDIPDSDIAAAQKRVDACDLTVPSTEPGPVECRLVRAVAQKAIPGS